MNMIAGKCDERSPSEKTERATLDANRRTMGAKRHRWNSLAREQMTRKLRGSLSEETRCLRKDEES